VALRISSLGNGLVVAGSLIGVAIVAMVATGTEVALTPAMIQLVIYKGLAAAAVGLIVVGSWIGRRGRQYERAIKPTDAPRAELASGPTLPLGAHRPRQEETIRKSRHKP
jgi:hypothetical protein